MWWKILVSQGNQTRVDPVRVMTPAYPELICCLLWRSLIEFQSVYLSLFFSSQNWSSPLQETSSTPWRPRVWTSCWEGKVGTLLWARSPSAQRRAPRFLELRPRGGGWSGRYFDTRFSSTQLCPRWRTFPRSPDTNTGRALTNSKCGLLCAKQTSPHAFSHAPTNTKTKSPRVLIDSIASFVRYFRPPAALLTRAVCCWRTVSVSSFPNSMHY